MGKLMREERGRALDALKQLSEGQLDELIFRLCLPRRFLVGSAAEPSRRCVQLLEQVEQEDSDYESLYQEIRQVRFPIAQPLAFRQPEDWTQRCVQKSLSYPSRRVFRYGLSSVGQ